MANRIVYNPAGYIDVTIEGDQTYMTFENLKADAETILEDMQKKGKKRYGLIDLTLEGSFTTDSNRAAMDILEHLNYDRVAIFGGTKINQEVGKAIILAMGKTSNTKIFKEKDEALAWLLDSNTNTSK